MIGETNAQAIPLFGALFSTLMLRGHLTEEKVQALIGTASAQLAPEVSRTLRVLFSSGYAETALRGGSRSARSHQILSKPYRRQELARKVRDMLVCESD